MAKRAKVIYVGDGVQLELHHNGQVAISSLDHDEGISRILTNPETIQRIQTEVQNFEAVRRG